MGSLATSKAIAKILRGLAEGNSLWPTFSSSSAASASERPFAVVISKSSASSASLLRRFSELYLDLQLPLAGLVLYLKLDGLH